MKLDLKLAHAPAIGRQASAALLAASLLFSPLHDAPLVPAPLRGVAQARELASGSGSRVNKDPNSLLRLGLPAQPKGLREAQVKIEEAADSLTRFLLTNAGQALNTAKGTLKGQSAAILKAVPASGSEQGKELLAAISTKVDAASQAIGSGNAAVGSRCVARAAASTCARACGCMLLLLLPLHGCCCCMAATEPRMLTRAASSRVRLRTCPSSRS